MPFDTSKIEGFDGMTAEQKVEAFLKLDWTDPVDMSKFVAKSEYEKVSADLKKLQASANGEDENSKELSELRQKYEALAKENTISKLKAQYSSMPGYSDDLASKAANAAFENDHETLFAIQRKAAEAYKKECEAAALKSMKKPTDGDPDGEDDDAVKLAKLLGKEAANSRIQSKNLEHYLK